MAQNKSPLRWDYSDYLPSMAQLTQIKSEKEIRAEYSYLRGIAQKRLSRLRKSEFAEAKRVKRWGMGFPKLSELPNAQVAKALANVALFLNAETSSVTGFRQQRKRALETLKAHGYDFVTAANIGEFGEYMEYWRNHKLDMLYASERVVDLFHFSQRSKIDRDAIFAEFEQFLSNSEKLNTINIPAVDTEVKQDTRELLEYITKR